jgi:AcrR family transcriptional regulator
MPKISQERKEARREQILEGARRCFAVNGYEGATVARLEAEIGLSRGAIFNYFPNKEALFVETAVASSERLTDVWLEHGFRAALEAIAHEDADWLGAMLESLARLRTDERLRALVEAKEAEARSRREERLERLREQPVRDDVAIESVAQLLSLVANGLALRRASGDPMPDLDELMHLVETGVAPRKVSRSATTRKTSTRAAAS